MRFEIKARVSGSTLFTAELDAKFDNSSESVKIGEAVKSAYLTGADLTGADLTGADLTGADLTGADLTGADLTGADLTGADLTGADLRGAYLTGADLTGADLTGADLTGADLTGADLTGADLTGADLRGAYLTGADLTGADLTGADLTGAYLTGAYLRGADGEKIKIGRLIARLTRIIDPYEFFAFRAEDGRCLIVAGCRGPWTIAQYREHVETYADKAKAEETTAILDFIKSRDKADVKMAKKAAAA